MQRVCARHITALLGVRLPLQMNQPLRMEQRRLRCHQVAVKVGDGGGGLILDQPSLGSSEEEVAFPKQQISI